ncbi:MAG TPA: hypothetical protein VLK34_08250 [Nocardioidaceae bacterium]|nr:hypothetical protein [Nocardioidaceae bacterium]
MRVLIVDGANVVGSRPDGWWRDRPGAARRLHERLTNAALDPAEVVLVLEGAAKAGVPAEDDQPVRVLHASGPGDDAIVAEVVRHLAEGGARDVVVVTADRELRDRVSAAGGRTEGPRWLLDQL